MLSDVTWVVVSFIAISCVYTPVYWMLFELDALVPSLCCQSSVA